MHHLGFIHFCRIDSRLSSSPPVGLCDRAISRKSQSVVQSSAKLCIRFPKVIPKELCIILYHRMEH